MPSRRKLMLPFTHWPIEDRRRWERHFNLVTCLMKMAPAPALPQLHVTGWRLREVLGFLSVKHPKLMTLPPEGRIDRRMAAVSAITTIIGTAAFAFWRLLVR
jgi:hypothetical protein